jgi:hypothetical protein
LATVTANAAGAHRKFDPTQYNESEMSKQNGKYSASDYQAALEARKFMKDNEKNLPDGKLNYQNIWEGASSGNVGGNGKVLNLTEKQKAAFEKLAADDFALFHRLSENNQLSIPSIEKGIKDPKALHGSRKPENDDYTDPTKGLNGPDSKKALSSYFNQQFGDDWKQVSTRNISQIANNGRYYDDEKKNWVTVDDPKVVDAAVWLVNNSGEVDKGGANSLGWISRSEFDNWNDV